MQTHPSLTGSPSQPYIRATLANASNDPQIGGWIFETFAALAG